MRDVFLDCSLIVWATEGDKADFRLRVHIVHSSKINQL